MLNLLTFRLQNIKKGEPVYRTELSLPPRRREALNLV